MDINVIKHDEEHNIFNKKIDEELFTEGAIKEKNTIEYLDNLCL